MTNAEATASRMAPPAPLCQLTRFTATDGVELSGLLYEPEGRSKQVALFLHGNGGSSIFDSGRTNLMATDLLEAGISYFPFNNRGAHLSRQIRKGSRRIDGGSAYEVIRDCVRDIDGAVAHLHERGYRRFHLIGHSTGANKVAVYDHYAKRNPFRRYVLLAGGDDTGLLYQHLGPRRFASALLRAKERLGERRGSELVPPGTAPMAMSWRSFYDMANPDGDYNVFPFLERLRDVPLSRRRLFRLAAAIRKPSLAIYGSDDEYCYGDVAGCVRVLRSEVGSNVACEIMDGADHSFSGQERELGRRIARFLG